MTLLWTTTEFPVERIGLDRPAPNHVGVRRLRTARYSGLSICADRPACRTGRPSPDPCLDGHRPATKLYAARQHPPHPDHRLRHRARRRDRHAARRYRGACEAGDVLVQQGTNHAWVNNGTKPCRIAFILIDAKTPPVAAGLEEVIDHPPRASAGADKPLAIAAHPRRPRPLRERAARPHTNHRR